MYLEISNVAAAIGKNPYEPVEKMLLLSWARHCPKTVKEFLLENNCIVTLKKNEETFSELQTKIYKKNLPDNFDVQDFSKIENNVIEQYKKSRNNEQTDQEIVKIKEYTQDSLKKDNGNLQEKNIIQSQKYTKGNNKMYYFNINKDACIGGKHDASTQDLLLEIKTRTRKQNVRKNEYDLCQLLCYLLATKNTTGKIVQIFNGTKYDSDLPNDNEYGIINITQEPWKQLSDSIINNLQEYFKELEELIITSEFKYLNTVIPMSIRPIAKTDKNNVFCEENIKFLNLINKINI